MAWPVVIATNGYGTPVTESDSEFAIPVEIAANGYGTPVVVVETGGTPVKGVGGYDPDVSVFFAAMTDPAGLTAQQKGWINDAVLAWKAAELWPLIGHLCLPLHDSQASRLNLKNPADALEGAINAPTFTAFKGFAGDASSSYLDSNYLVDGPNIFTQDSAAFYATINATPTDTASNTNTLAGASSNSNPISYLRPRVSADLVQGRVNSATNDTAGPSTTRLGRYAASRTGALNTGYYKNGALLGEVATASLGPLISGRTMWWLRFTTLYSADRVGLRMIGAGMTQAQMQAFDATALTLLTNLGAN